MIELTRFDGTRFFVNVEFIEFVETTPDTVVSLVDHKKLLVREPATEIVRRILDYRAHIGGMSPGMVTSLIRWANQEHEHNRDSITERLREGEDEG